MTDSSIKWKIEELPDLKGFTIEWADEGNFISSKRNKLYRSSDLETTPKQIATIAAPLWKAALSGLRLGQRFLRFMVTNVVVLANGDLFVTFDKSVGLVRDGKYAALPGLVRPCRVLRSACAIDADGSVYFGEYLANKERNEMRVYKYSPGKERVETAYIFDPNSIRHIHGIYFDDFSQSLVCLTGDEDSECRMLRSNDGFKSVEIIGEGDESWRAVSILFTEDRYFYGTDAEFRSNQIYEVDRNTLMRKSIGEVSGTVFYSKRLGTDFFFTTTAENAPSQEENVAALWHLDANGRCSELVKFAKDGWNGTLFMFGTIHFPYRNETKDELFFSLVGVKEDNRTFCVKRI